MTDVDFSQFGRASAGENLTSRQTIAQRQNRKQSERARIEDSIARHQIVQGQFLVSGVGELAKEVVFPVKFIEKPLLSFGGELAENSSPTDGGFPTISVVVGGWNLEIPGETNQETPDRKYFVGANLLVVTTGTDENMWIHWHMSGMAITNPVAGIRAATTDSTL
jgi:hypothetical protein